MKYLKYILCTLLALPLVLVLPAVAGDLAKYSETRQPCASHDPLKIPLFGDLHVHTRYSLDASTQGTRTSPDQAYRFAQGEEIGIQPWLDSGDALRALQLDRPLDFAMVSDHAELIGEVHICNTPDVEGYDSWQCKVYRYWPRGAFYLFNYYSSVKASHLGFCGAQGVLCTTAAMLPWREMQEAAEQHYDHRAISTAPRQSCCGAAWTISVSRVVRAVTAW